MQDGVPVHNECKAGAVSLTLGDDSTLIELAVATNGDFPEMAADHGQDFVQRLRGSLGAGSIAGPIDGAPTWRS